MDAGTKSLKNFAGKLQNLGKSLKDDIRERKVSNEQIKFNKIKIEAENVDEDDDEFQSIKEYKKMSSKNKQD